MGMFLASRPPRSALTDPRRNIGVLQTTVAEMITVKEHQRQSPHAGPIRSLADS